MAGDMPQPSSGGTPAAFLAEFVAHHRRLYGYIGALLPAHGDVDDVYQQTCLRLWEKQSLFDPSRPFFPWACGFARHQVLQHVRAAGRHRLHLSVELLEKIAQDQESLDREGEARRAALAGCLEKLQGSQRSLIQRCYAGTESIKGIAGDMGISPAALTMRLQRIRHALVRCVERAVAAMEGA